MPSLKAIRKRIASVKNTQKITKAMKMVAAAKLRRAQDAVVAMRPYAGRMKKVASDLAERIGGDLDALSAGAAAEGQDLASQVGLLLSGSKEQKIRLVVVTSDRGLAGAFNSSVIRRTERFLVERADAKITVDVLGKKGRDALRRKKTEINQELAGADGKTAARLAQELAAQLSQAVASGEVDSVYVVYNQFKNAASQIIQLDRLLPIVLASPQTAGGPPKDEPVRVLIDFAYEPSKQDLVQHLLPLYLETELLRIFLESIASEFGARMSAMDNASRNAKEMISRLTLQYNRARQAAITKELMEIVGGAEALKG